MIPATKAARKLRLKLQALAERGIDGEKDSAIHKLAALEAKYDFTAREEDLFTGVYQRSSTSLPLCSFSADETDIGSFAKWAIEHGCGIAGAWRYAGFEMQLWVEAGASSLTDLRRVAETVRRSFADLWSEFASVPGVRSGDRRNFHLGLYDGLMADPWKAGTPLPAVIAHKVRQTRGRKALALAPGLALHPYGVALELGRKIRLNTDIAEVIGDLQNTIGSLENQHEKQ